MIKQLQLDLILVIEETGGNGKFLHLSLAVMKTSTILFPFY